MRVAETEGFEARWWVEGDYAKAKGKRRDGWRVVSGERLCQGKREKGKGKNGLGRVVRCDGEEARI